ncbi:MAG: PadR family transcriptional regulator [Rhodothermaceae bacterium]|nr:PadR family transcriptional regulator [Rhodothermaceae bacterium]
MASANRTEFAVLGLLALGARSGYDIKKMADDALGHFWNESFGHIYPILKRLEQRDWVTKSVEPQEGRPDRKVYALTPAGHEALQEWFASPIEPVPPREELLLKLFLGPLTPPAALIEQVEQYRAAQREDLAQLDGLVKQVEREESNNPGLPFWLLTVDHHRAMLRARLRWSADALTRLRSLIGGNVPVS